MTRPQWFFVCLTAAVAFVAYVKADTVFRRFNAQPYRPATTWTA